jgi:hypothetical protein
MTIRLAKPIALLVLASIAVTLVAGTAKAQSETCPRVVVFTLPGVMWEDIARWEPPAILDLVDRGAAGSMSVRANSSRTSYGDGYLSIGGGARLDDTAVAGAPAELGTPEGPLTRDARVDVSTILELADEAGYGAVPGALAGALDDVPIVAIGNADLGVPAPAPAGGGRWTLLTAMHPDGVVELSATGPNLLIAGDEWPYGVRTDPAAVQAAVDAALETPCAAMVVDQGDLARADRFADRTFSPAETERRRALAAADDLLGYVAERLNFERDLLLVASPTSPAWLPVAHLGVAIAVGPGFEPGDTLESSSTRRRGVVTLPDVAPTVLRHLDVAQPAEMNGRPWFSSPGQRNVIGAAIDLDAESVFVDRLKGPISTWFVIAQVVVYVLALALLGWRESRAAERSTGTTLGRWLEVAALALVAFPIATFFAGVAKAHSLGVAGFVGLLLAIDAALVLVATLVVKRPLDRLLVLTALTLATMAIDLMMGSRLQLNTVLGYSPIVAGRFAGAGNIAFAILGVSTVLTGALLVNRWPGTKTLWLVAGLFALAVLIDGAPAFGSDVGGVLALVPALAVTWVLLSGRRPSVRVMAIGVAGAVAALGIFLVIDLSGPPESRTHLGRLVEDMGDRGFEVLVDTIERKASANLRVFRSTIWTLFVPPALAALGWLLARPRGRWGKLAESFPKLRAGLMGGLLVAVLGFMVNDSGIVIPAVVLSFLVPMAMIVHLMIEMKEPAAAGSPAPERVRG